MSVIIEALSALIMPWDCPLYLFFGQCVRLS
jgi:hypothetical protein